MATVTTKGSTTTTKISAGAVDNRPKRTADPSKGFDQANIIRNLVAGIRSTGSLTVHISAMVDLAVKAKALAKGIKGTADNLGKAFPEAGWQEVTEALKDKAGKKSVETIFGRVCKDKGLKEKTKGPGFGPANVLSLLKGLKDGSSPEDWDSAAWKAEMLEAIDAYIEMEG